MLRYASNVKICQHNAPWTKLRTYIGINSDDIFRSFSPTFCDHHNISSIFLSFQVCPNWIVRLIFWDFFFSMHIAPPRSRYYRDTDATMF